PAALFACRVLARLDRLELVWFEARRGLEGRFAVRDLGGRVMQGGEGVAAIVRALPAGPPLAALLALPPLRAAIDAVLRLAVGRTSRFFGLDGRRRAPEPAPSLAVRKVGLVAAGVRELLIAAFFVGALNQAAVELWSIKRRWKIP